MNRIKNYLESPSGEAAMIALIFLALLYFFGQLFRMAI